MVKRLRLGRMLAAITLVIAMAQPALARRHHQEAAPKAAAKPAPVAADAGKPTLVGSFGEWGAYATEGKSKVCYALGKPKDRSPGSLKKDQAYVFISSRPSEGVRNEISVMMGLPLKESGAVAKAEIGTTSFDLVAKGQNAWIKNAADESRAIEAMRKGGKLIVKGTLVKGGVVTDSYSLAGLAQALDRVTRDCR